MKKILFILFIFFSHCLLAQKVNKFWLTNVEGYTIKISQLNDTAVKLIMPKDFNKTCRTTIYLHGGALLQVISMQTSNGGFKLVALPNNIKKKLTVGAKITFEAICINGNGRHVPNPYYSSTYTIIAD